MAAGAQLSVTDQRRVTRHPVNYRAECEHRDRGEIQLHLRNMSATGFLIHGAAGFSRGERVILRLPVIGRIEAYCMWIADERAGFQFERIIRLDDFAKVIEHLQPNPRLRPRN